MIFVFLADDMKKENINYENWLKKKLTLEKKTDKKVEIYKDCLCRLSWDSNILSGA